MTHELSRTLDVRGYRDEDGNTLLHTACVAVQEKIAEVLTLNYGLKIDELNYANQTPLVVALQCSPPPKIHPNFCQPRRALLDGAR